jgi:transcriptional regulator of acetoin/glycerol metabolism
MQVSAARRSQGSTIRIRRSGKDLSKEELLELLETSGWNKAQVARRLGVSRTAVWKYLTLTGTI